MEKNTRHQNNLFRANPKTPTSSMPSTLNVPDVVRQVLKAAVDSSSLLDTKSLMMVNTHTYNYAQTRIDKHMRTDPGFLVARFFYAAISHSFHQLPNTNHDHKIDLIITTVRFSERAPYSLFLTWSRDKNNKWSVKANPDEYAPLTQVGNPVALPLLPTNPRDWTLKQFANSFGPNTVQTKVHQVLSQFKTEVQGFIDYVCSGSFQLPTKEKVRSNPAARGVNVTLQNFATNTTYSTTIFTFFNTGHLDLDFAGTGPHNPIPGLLKHVYHSQQNYPRLYKPNHALALVQPLDLNPKCLARYFELAALPSSDQARSEISRYIAKM